MNRILALKVLIIKEEMGMGQINCDKIWEAMKKYHVEYRSTDFLGKLGKSLIEESLFL